jgi:DNA-binding transcriptional LysR family regulator
MLDVRRLRVLREVALRGTIAAAAEALHLTGPAVSQHLTALEREAGVTLLERDGRSVRLTAAAETLVAHTETILAQIEAAEADLAAGEGSYGGDLRIAAFPTFGRHLSDALRALREAMPGVRIAVRELEPEQALTALRTGEVEVAVAHEYAHLRRRIATGLQRVSLLREPMLLALPAEHPHAADSVALADFADEPGWILPPLGLTCHDEVRLACAAAGFEPSATSVAYSYDVTLALVAAGGLALVPQLAAVDRRDDVTLAQVTDVAVWRETFAAVRRGSAHRPSIARSLTELRAAADTLTTRSTRRRPAARSR